MKNFTLTPTLLLLLTLIGCANIKDPEFRRIDSFRVKNVSLSQGTVGFKVTFYNPNDFTVTVKETEADVYIDNLSLGTFKQDSTITVKSASEFSIPVSGSVPLGVFLQLNLQDLSSREMLLKANGSTKVGKAGIFVTKPFEYQGKHKLNDIKL